MELRLFRKEFSEVSTIGQLFIDKDCYCDTLEDKDRQIQIMGAPLEWKSSLKIPAHTAIPYGKYELITNFSNRFKQDMPLLLNVPDFLGVRIHNGNTHEHTEGCILVGIKSGADFIGKSKQTYRSLYPIIAKAVKKGKVFITIERLSNVD